MAWKSISIADSALEAAGRIVKGWGQLTPDERYSYLTEHSKEGLKHAGVVCQDQRGKFILARIDRGVFGLFRHDVRDFTKCVLTYLVTDYTLIRKLENGDWTI
jgi:hypothetical protein